MTHATLCYVIKDGKILLIKSKRGVSKGKWNGPGGKVQDSETPLEAAARETKEETGIMPVGAEFAGYNEFFTGDKIAFRVHVFVAKDFKGELRETDEGMPKWFPLDALPLKEMWADDEVWVPLMLAGKKFSGKFYYDDGYKNMLRHEIEIVGR